MFSLGLILVFLFLALSSLASTVNYCDPSLCTRNNIVKHHIGCDNNGEFGSHCKEPAIIEITPKMQNSILFWHNDYRNKVANGSLKGFRSAQRMTTVTWDDELAYLASLNVVTCKLAHDECHNTNKYKYSGQNVAIRYQAAEITQAMYEHIAALLIKEWFKEYEKANQSDVDKCTASGLSKSIGHFTAMIQEKSAKLGCSLVRFTEVLLGENFFAILFACNYSFTNVIGMPIYVKGPKGSACETGTNPNFNGLCSLAEYVPPVRYSDAVDLPVSEHPAYNPEPLDPLRADLGLPLPPIQVMDAVNLLVLEHPANNPEPLDPMKADLGLPLLPNRVLDAVNLPVSEHPAYNPEPLDPMKADLGLPLPPNRELLAADLPVREDPAYDSNRLYPMKADLGLPLPPNRELLAADLPVREDPAYDSNRLYPMKADLGLPLPPNRELLAADLPVREDPAYDSNRLYPMITYRGDPLPPIQVLDPVNLPVTEHPVYNPEPLYPMLTWRGNPNAMPTSYKTNGIQRRLRRRARRTTIVTDEWPFSNLTRM